MMELVLAALIFLILGYLVIKAVGNILKGLLFLFLAVLIYSIISFSLPSEMSYIGNFVKIPFEKVKSIFLKVEIVSVSKVNNNLVIVIKNSGYLPLTNFSVKIDENEANILNKPSILLPKNLAVLEVEWNKSFKIVEVEANGAKAIYKASSL